MTEHVFSPEMMRERETQLILALSDCAGAYCDINFSQNKILRTAIQSMEELPQAMRDRAKLSEDHTYAEVIHYWGSRLDPAEQPGFFEFFDIDTIKARYAAGERCITHRYWTRAVAEEPILAVQKILLYEDCVTGDLLGLTYVSDDRQYHTAKKREEELNALYEEAAHRAAVLQKASVNVPGGYHRCSNEPGYPFRFVSRSFEQLVGYTREQLRTELNDLFINLVLPEDLPRFAQLAEGLAANGVGDVAYRIRRRDGEIRWLQDSSMLIDWEGEPGIQATVSDITDFVHQQEQFALQQIEFDEIAENIPCGYHRCTVDNGFKLEFVSESFVETMGYDSRDELMGMPFLDLVYPEDRDLFMAHEPELAGTGKVDLVYRIIRKDGSIRWIKDSTMRVQYHGKDTYQCILMDITDNVEELNAAVERAEASSQAKSTFLFNASHDIRTPMNAIQGFAHIIQENRHDPDKVADAVGKIQQATDTLMTLMNDVLELSRIEQGKEELTLEAIDLYEAGKNLYEMFAAEMEAAGIHFAVDGEELHDIVLCDELKLTRVVMNMLSNAKKFTPAGGTVTFGGQCLHRDEHSGTYRIFVRDTGIGMSQTFQEKAFEQFERERTSTESRVTGSGLGLAIIKKLVELMGGQVSLESTLGRGTEIAVTLTFRLAEKQQETDAQTAREQLDMTGRRALLVEDNDFNREIARYVLESMHFDVDEAENGAICVEKVASGAPGYYDVILMDIQMPVMDGYAATIAIRGMEDPVRSATPIIAMTANAFEEDRQRCLAVGMNGHIGKPIQLAVLAQEFSRTLGHSQV